MKPETKDLRLSKPWRDTTTKTQRKLHTSPIEWSMDYGLLTLVIKKGNDGMWWAACRHRPGRSSLGGSTNLQMALKVFIVVTWILHMSTGTNLGPRWWTQIIDKNIHAWTTPFTQYSDEYTCDLPATTPQVSEEESL